LENDVLKVTFSGDRPVIHEYLNKSTNSIISGNLQGSPPAITYFQRARKILQRLRKILKGKK